MAAEEVLFEQGHARVTTTKVQIGGTTYPLNGITSVSTDEVPESPFPGLLVSVVGGAVLLLALLCASGLSASDLSPSGWDWDIGIVAMLFAFGGLALVGGVGTLLRLGTWHTVTLGTAGGDRQALSTRDRVLASNVRSAIEQAITRRG